MHPDRGIDRDDKRPDIQRGTLAGRNPVLIERHQLLDRFDRKRLIDRRNAQPVVREVQARHIFVRAEQHHLAFRGAVGLHALKDLLAVMQAHRGRIQRNIAVGHDPWVVPALALVVIHQKHVVGKNIAETQLGGIGGLRLGGRRFLHRNAWHDRNTS